MKSIRDLVKTYPTVGAAAIDLKVHRDQLVRWINADALYNVMGEVWTPGKNKLTLSGRSSKTEK